MKLTPPIKRLLIPLCHSFILLPIAAILTGSPSMGPLFLLLLLLFALSAAGWALQELMPQRTNVFILMGMLLALGMALGYTLLVPVYQGLSQGSVLDTAAQPWWIQPIFGLIAFLIMTWSLLDCRKGLESGLSTHMIGIGLALYIFTYFSYRATGLYVAEDKSDLYQPIFLFGCIWLILALVVINYQFVLKMAYSKNQSRPAKALMIQNIFFSLGLCAIIILTSCFGALRRGFNYLLQQLVTLMGNVSGAVGEWIFYTESSEPEEEQQPIEMPEQPADTTPEWLLLVNNIIIWMLVIAIGGFVLWLLGRKLWSLFKSLGTWMQGRISGLQKQEEEYQQEEEVLLGWDQFKQELGERIRRRRRRIPRYEELPDARARLRWLFSRLREQLIRKKRFISTATPAEMAEGAFAGNRPMEDMLIAYDEARYSDHEISDKAAEEALAAMKKLHL